MGHITAKDAFQTLRAKLDRMPVGAPGQSTIYDILKTVFTEEEAALASRMPFRLSPLGSLARRFNMKPNVLQKKLEVMADKGLVFDLELGGKTRYMLMPTMVGFFEFSMMRLRDDFDQAKLAGLFHQYILEEPEFLGQFQKGTQTTPFRTLVHEETYSEILDWERASYLVQNTQRWSVGLCHCRHIAHHQGHDCERFPLETCLSMGKSADYVIQHHFGRSISQAEALDLLGRSRDAGLIHIADNVKNEPAFICNCCGCCCEILLGFKKFKVFGNTFSSNYLPEVNSEACIGCNICKKSCPIDAIAMVPYERQKNGKRLKQMAKVDESICLGCGVCALRCENQAIRMKYREKRRIPPENVFARVLTMAIEQGKLHELLVDKDDGLTAHTANLFINALMNLPPGKQLLARANIKSRFVDYLVGRINRKPHQPVQKQP